jgi:hypothetical protein
LGDVASRHRLDTWMVPAGHPCAAAYVGRPWGPRSQRFSGKAAWSELTAVAATGAVSGLGRPRGLPSEAEQPRRHPVRGRRSAIRRYNRAQAAHLILMGGCDPCAAGGTLLRQESCAKGDAVWLPGAAGRHLRLSSSCRGGTIPMTDVLPQTGADPEHHPRPSRPAGVVAVPYPHGGRAGWRG